MTFTLAEIAALAGQPLPASTGLRSYWWSHQQWSITHRLAALGWRVAHFDRDTRAGTVARHHRRGGDVGTLSGERRCTLGALRRG